MPLFSGRTVRLLVEIAQGVALLTRRMEDVLDRLHALEDKETDMDDKVTALKGALDALKTQADGLADKIAALKAARDAGDDATLDAAIAEVGDIAKTISDATTAAAAAVAPADPAPAAAADPAPAA